MKKIMLVLIWILILPITIVAAEEEIEVLFEYWYFENVDEMRDASSDIVQLEILDERAEWVNPWDGFR